MLLVKNLIGKKYDIKGWGNLLDENDIYYVCLNIIFGKFNLINILKSEKILRVIKLRFC